MKTELAKNTELTQKKPIMAVKRNRNLKFAKSFFYSIAALLSLQAIAMPAHACNIPKSYYKNVSCTASSRYFLAVKDSGAPVALINKQGNRAVDLSRYSQVDVSKLKNGIMPVQRAGRVGYVNMSGREVVPAIYDPIMQDPNTQGWARAANNDRIIVKKRGGFGIISANNNVILPFSSSYKTITDFSAGVAKVVKGNETFWIDTNARRTANPNIRQPTIKTPLETPNLTQNSQNKSYQNSDRQVIPNSSLGRSEIWQPEKRDGKWGFIDRNGVPMITFSFEQVTPFSEGLAGVRFGDKWGFVNLAGELIIPFRFEESGIDRKGTTGEQPFVFKEGKAWIGNLKNGKKMCIDTKGNGVGC